MIRVMRVLTVYIRSALRVLPPDLYSQGVDHPAHVKGFGCTNLHHHTKEDQVKDDSRRREATRAKGTLKVNVRLCCCRRRFHLTARRWQRRAASEQLTTG